jgi:shikimate dehydrogenase
MTAPGQEIVIPRGTTRLFAVLGDPVTQVQAPELMNELFAAARVDAVMVPVHVRPNDLDSVLKGLKRIANLDGILVTIPHKFDVCRHVDHLSPVVELTGSANALRREPDGSWSAENFDGQGFVVGLKKAGYDPRGKQVALLGAGGAGASIAAAAGVASLAMTDVSPERLEQLAQRLASRWPGQVRVSSTPVLSGVDIAINATPLGLRPDDSLPFDPSLLQSGAVVADIIMKPAETRLLQAAAQHGLPIHHGIHMLTEQIDLYRQYFRIAKPDRETSPVPDGEHTLP